VGPLGFIATLSFGGVSGLMVVGWRVSILVEDGVWVDRGDGRWSRSEICCRDGRRVMRWL
jgi:hypothetical protein